MSALFAWLDSAPDSIVLVIVGVLFMVLCHFSNRRHRGAERN